jgi:hypothetical protein
VETWSSLKEGLLEGLNEGPRNLLVGESMMERMLSWKSNETLEVVVFAFAYNCCILIAFNPKGMICSCFCTCLNTLRFRSLRRLLDAEIVGARMEISG